jgi:hypothetical protein
LDFKSKAVASYEALGNKAAADRIRKDQEALNLEIVQDFRKDFTFCRIYFISYDSTKAAMAGRKSGYFLNDQLKLDPSIVMKESFFLFAEFGMLETPLKEDKLSPDQEEERRGTMSDVLLIRDKRWRH